MFNLSATATGIVLVATAAWPPTVFCPLFVWMNRGNRLMRKDMLIIIHLPPQLHPRAAGHQSRILFFFSPPAGLPAGAARLPGREVTARGRPNVTAGTEEASFICCLLPFSLLLPYITMIKVSDLCLFFLQGCNNGSHSFIKVSLNVEFCAFLCPVKCKNIPETPGNGL